jgi:hypothetical protein
MKTLAYLLAFITFSQSTLFVCAQDELSLNRDHITGVIQAHQSNLESWRRGDFLIRIRTSGSGRYIDFEKSRQSKGNGLVYVSGPDSMSLVNKKDHLHRVIFDFDNEKLIVINRVAREQQLYDGLDNDLGSPVKSYDDRIVLLNKPLGIGATRIKAGLIHNMGPENQRSVVELLDIYGIPNIMLLGCGTLGDWTSDQQRRFDLLGNLDSMEQITHVGKNRYQVFSRLDIVPTNKMLGARVYVDWDVQKLVPVKYSVYNGYREEDFPGATKPQWTGSANWMELKGSYVPKSARLSNDSLVKVSGRYFHVSDDTSIDVHWFSLNQELPDRLFEEKLLHDRKKLDEMMNQDVFEKGAQEKRD